jgi:hypothetical protein
VPSLNKRSTTFTNFTTNSGLVTFSNSSTAGTATIINNDVRVESDFEIFKIQHFNEYRKFVWANLVVAGLLVILLTVLAYLAENEIPVELTILVVGIPMKRCFYQRRRHRARSRLGAVVEALGRGRGARRRAGGGVNKKRRLAAPLGRGSGTPSWRPPSRLQRTTTTPWRRLWH